MKTPSGKKFLVEAVSPKVLIWRFDKAINWWFTKGNAKSIAWRQIKVFAPGRSRVSVG